jgi:carbamoyl-phosphate synthase small subunit
LVKHGEKRKAALVLKDGTILFGSGFGHATRVVGEVVFNTGMVGYTEALTDPSYKGQILAFTYPLIGNYGVPSYANLDQWKLPKYFESNKVQVTGAIIHELCESPNHWASVETLDAWLQEEKVPGIFGVDTRSLTIELREYGVMMGALEVSYDEIDVDKLKEDLDKSQSYGELNFVERVSVKKPQTYGAGKETVVLMDYGVKYGIIRRLLERNLSVVRVPYDYPTDKILSYKPSGVLVSNGPGDPKACTHTFETLRDLMEMNMPTLGICLGVQTLALAAGADTYKLRYGHRGQNKPCTDLDAGRSYVTSQNHGYAVDADSLKGTGFRTWFINADDGTVEGIKHERKSLLAVQFHPEASPGPYDTDYVFDMFAKIIRR